MCIFENSAPSFYEQYGQAIVSIISIIVGAGLSYLFTAKVNKKQLAYNRNQNRIQSVYIPLATEIEKFHDSMNRQMLDDDGEIDKIKHYYSKEFSSLIQAIMHSASAQKRHMFDHDELYIIDKLSSLVRSNEDYLFSSFINLQALHQVMNGLSVHDRSFTFEKLRNLMVDNQISGPIREGSSDLGEFDTKVHQIYQKFINLYDQVNIDVNILYDSLIKRIDKLSAP